MHCVCCPIALVSLERNSGERKRDAGKKGRKKMRELCAGKRIGCSERAQRAEIAAREKERVGETEGQEGTGGREKEKEQRAREGKRNAGTPRANHSRRSANNLLVFHVRFDSLSFRYLYLSDLLRISGICATNGRNAGKNAAASGTRAMSGASAELCRFSAKAYPFAAVVK